MLELKYIRNFQVCKLSKLTHLPMQYCLGNEAWQPCYVVRLNHTTVMLDCSLDLSVLLNFLPLPLVYRWVLLGAPLCRTWTPEVFGPLKYLFLV